MRAVHRIDRDTSGVGRVRPHAGGRDQSGQAIPRPHRRPAIPAITRGRPVEGRIESWLIDDRGDGRRGSGPVGQGQRAVTHVRAPEQLGPCYLVECRLETGRTHQVRIHLGEAGAALAGERVYDRPRTRPGSGPERFAAGSRYMPLIWDSSIR